MMGVRLRNKGTADPIATREKENPRLLKERQPRKGPVVEWRKCH